MTVNPSSTALDNACEVSQQVDKPSPERRLVLVEPNAHMLGGHWSDNIVLIAEAARERGAPLTVASANGVYPDTHAALARAGATMLCEAKRDLAARLYTWLARLLERSFELAHWARPKSAWPYELTRLSHWFVETASLRIALTAGPHDPPPNIVVLSAGDTLPAAAAALSRAPHVRIVHEMLYGGEGMVLRLIEFTCRRARRGVMVVCPTLAVRSALKGRYPNLRSVVQPFAIADPRMYIGAEERTIARRSLGLRS